MNMKNSYNSQTIVFIIDFNFNVIYSEKYAYALHSVSIPFPIHAVHLVSFCKILFAIVYSLLHFIALFRRRFHFHHQFIKSGIYTASICTYKRSERLIFRIMMHMMNFSNFLNKFTFDTLSTYHITCEPISAILSTAPKSVRTIYIAYAKEEEKEKKKVLLSKF